MTRCISLVIMLFCVSSFAQFPVWKFIAVGDTRGSSSTDPINVTILSELAQEIVQQQAEFVIVPGDLVYAGSQPLFQNWKDIMAPVYQAGIQVFPVLGNHDASDILSYLNLFKNDIPTNGPPGETYRTFAFYNKNVLIVGMDNYVSPHRINQTWLNQVFAQNTLPHIFVFAHEPAFKANHTDCMDDYPTNRDAFWNSLINSGCKIYFCGHDHFYDRLKAGGIYQMIVGMGGAPFHTSYSYNGSNSSWNPVNQYHAAVYGYTLVTINNLTVTVEFYKRQSAGNYISNDVWSYAIIPTLSPPNNFRIIQ